MRKEIFPTAPQNPENPDGASYWLGKS